MATIKFYTRSKIEKLAPVYIRFTDGRDINIRIPTPYRIIPKYWNEKKQDLRSKILYTQIFSESEAQDIKNKFEQLKDFILREHFKLTNKATKEWLQDIIDRFYYKQTPGTENLNQYIKRFIDEATSGERLAPVGNTSKRYSSGTLGSYQDFRRSFNLYQGIYEETKRKRKIDEPKRQYKPVNFDDVTIDLYNDLLQFFYSRNCGPNYVGKIIKILKTIMRAAKEEKLHNNSEIDRKAFKVLREKVDSIYLTEAELKKLYDLDLSDQKHLEVVRDVFLVGCYTAQRYSDYSWINKDNIKTYSDNKVIELVQAKTGEKCIIPIRPELDAILQKYDYTLPKTYEQKMNKYIKDIGKLAGIEDIIHVEQNKGGLIIKKDVKKYELIKTHTARRTGCSLMYLARIPVIDIMKISGHRTETEFLKYILVGKEETAVNLAHHPYFVGNVLKIV
jgi:hypothetical protein